MIASLNGLVLVKSPNVVILDVGGVGYEVFISVRTYDALPATGASCFLLVQTVVREDAITLYGFGKKEEKELFLLLITVSGIGPKLAQTILSGIGVEALCRAITAASRAIRPRAEPSRPVVPATMPVTIPSPRPRQIVSKVPIRGE